MPRHARVVFAGVPHHVTQRGNQRREVFFERGDGLAYLRLLGQYTRQFCIEVVAYCLMPNHVHLVLIPSAASGLHLALKAIHGRYAQRINRMQGKVGHLWQNRYFSSPLDSNYFLHAVKYVELNPVRARLVERAEEYEWSSAAIHCGIRRDLTIAPRPRSIAFNDVADWSRWLAEGSSSEAVSKLRTHERKNLPCGSPDFVASLESAAGRSMQCRPRGRPARTSKLEDADTPFLKR